MHRHVCESKLTWDARENKFYTWLSQFPLKRAQMKNKLDLLLKTSLPLLFNSTHFFSLFLARFSLITLAKETHKSQTWIFNENLARFCLYRRKIFFCWYIMWYSVVFRNCWHGRKIFFLIKKEEEKKCNRGTLKWHKGNFWMDFK